MSVCGKCGKNFDTVTSGSNIYCPDCCKEIEAAGFPIREILEKSADKPKTGTLGGIKDSGERTTFSTGAQRDMHSGKGRMDLLPWAAIIEVSKHCEAGALKYGTHNVDKGIPTSSLMDSSMRHAAKYLDGQEDEDHLLAAAWNLLWAIEMRSKKPECVDTPWREEKV